MSGSKSGWVQSIDRSAGPLSAQRSRQYRPAILRLPSLLLVTVIALVLIAVLEYASRELPSARKGDLMDLGQDLLTRRQEMSAAVEPFDPAIPPVDDLMDLGQDLLTRRQEMSAAVEPYDPVPTVGEAEEPTDVDWIPEPPQSSKEEDAYVPIVTPTAKESDAYVPLPSDGGVVVPPVVQPAEPIITPTPGGGEPLTDDRTGTSATNPGAFVPTKPPSGQPADAFVPTKTTVASTIGSSASTFTTAVLVMTTDAQGRATSVLTTQVATTTVPIVSDVILETTQEGTYRLVSGFPLWWIFVGNYLPVLLATLFEVIYTAIFAKIKLITPFVALSNVRGAIMKNSMVPYFVTTNLMPLPIVSLLKGNWLMLLVTVTYSLVGLLPALASESLFMDTHWDCPNPNLAYDGANPCWPPRLSVNSLVIRILQALLALIAFMTVALALMVRRLQTGIYCDPSSIASVASLTHHPSVLDDFASLNPEATDKELVKHLGLRRYALRDYQAPDGSWRYGIIAVDDSGNPLHMPLPIPTYPPPVPGYPNQYMPVANPAVITSTVMPVKKGASLLEKLLDIGFVAFLLGALILIVVYYKDGSNSAFNNFFNSNGFGPRFIMTFLGTVIAGNWGRLQRRVQSASAFRELGSSSPPGARQSILMRTHCLHVTSIFPQLLAGHLFPALVSFVALLAEPLVILLSGIPFMPGQVFAEFLGCTYGSMGILAVMIATILGMLWWYASVPYLPRDPGNVAGLMSYVTKGSLGDDMDGLEVRNTSDRDRLVMSWNKGYSYGKSRGDDGIERYTVTAVN